MQRRLIRCVECNEIISLTEHDFSPEYRYDEEKDCFIEQTKNDREPFVTKHKDHSTEELKVNGASFVSQSPYSEPLKTCYFEATNGSENFVIKRWRDTIEAPVEYELFKGHIEITDPKVEVQTTHIRRQIEADMDHLIPEEKINRFIKKVETVVSQLNPKTLLEDSLESDCPSVMYCRLMDNTIDSIVEQSKDIFNRKEAVAIQDFIYENIDYDGVMAPLVRFHFEIKYSNGTGENLKGDSRIIGEIDQSAYT